jgi:hypothetical protein
MNCDQNLQDLYLTYIAMPVDPTAKKRMTIRRAAGLCGITARTVRHWRIGSPAFRERERSARQEGIVYAKQLARAAAAALLPQAITTLAEVLYDTSVPISVRASVAMRVMTWCGAGDVVEEKTEQDRWAILLRDLHTSTDEP